MAAVNVAASVANQVVNTAYSIVKPHYDAYQAGVYAEQMELKRIVASTTGAGIDNQSLQRANDNGVYRNYQAQGVNPALQVVPTGPMQRLTFGKTAGFSQWELDDVAAVDAMFRAGKVQVYGPGEINSSNGVRILGASYNQLSEQQRFGLSNTTYVYGDVDMTKFGIPAAQAPLIPGFTDPLSFGGASPGGLVVMDTVNPPAKFEDTVVHELQHASDMAILNVSNQYLTDSTLSATERAIVNEAHNSAMLVEVGTFDQVVANSNYVNRFKEVHAYSVDAANVEDLADHISKGTSLDGTTFQPIPIDEARVIADDLINSEALQEIDQDFDTFLNFLATQ